MLDKHLDTLATLAGPGARSLRGQIDDVVLRVQILLR
jgi:hypothetical protein